MIEGEISKAIREADIDSEEYRFWYEARAAEMDSGESGGRARTNPTCYEAKRDGCWLAR